MPVNKNIIRINGKEYELDSVIVESNGSFYVPKEAVQLFKNTPDNLFENPSGKKRVFIIRNKYIHLFLNV